MYTSQHAYLSRLDHLRFLAAILVVWFHFFHTHVGDLRSGNPLVSLVDEGHTGIALFMVISGFIFRVIAGDRDVHYLGFMRNRALRIYPLFVFAVFLQLMVSTYNDHRNYGFLQLIGWLVPFRSETVPLSPYFAQLWTIWVEFQFYLLFPLLLVFSRRIGQRYLWGLLGLLMLVRLLVFAASGSVRFLAYETIFGRLDQFLVGMLLGARWLSVMGSQGRFERGLSPLWVLVAAVAVLLGVHLFSRVAGYSDIGSPVWIVWPLVEAALWAGFFWAYLRARGFAAGGLGARLDRALAALGTISFSIYVMHNLVIAAVNAQVPLLPVSEAGGVRLLATTWLVVMPAVLAVATVTYVLIERPFLKLRGSYLQPKADTQPQNVSAQQHKG